MLFDGILIGAATFFIIGIYHPIVIKGEYYFGTKIWPLFLLTGIACIAISLFVSSHILSAACAVLGFSSLWAIRELFEQRDRVQKGWFPANPGKTKEKKVPKEVIKDRPDPE